MTPHNGSRILRPPIHHEVFGRNSDTSSQNSLQLRDLPKQQAKHNPPNSQNTTTTKMKLENVLNPVDHVPAPSPTQHVKPASKRKRKRNSGALDREFKKANVNCDARGESGTNKTNAQKTDRDPNNSINGVPTSTEGTSSKGEFDSTLHDQLTLLSKPSIGTSNATLYQKSRMKPRMACEQCRQWKRKCDQETPCAPCRKEGKECERKPVATKQSSVTSDFDNKLHNTHTLLLESISVTVGNDYDEAETDNNVMQNFIRSYWNNLERPYHCVIPFEQLDEIVTQLTNGETTIAAVLSLLVLGIGKLMENLGSDRPNPYTNHPGSGYIKKALKIFQKQPDSSQEDYLRAEILLGMYLYLRGDIDKTFRTVILASSISRWLIR
ncbi:hypothetical protein F4679DRAFT_583907 [Xylaria curta]|nr:hypothetical protein F4679DRAFT_583907 [Xylaria curta]